jgi:cephalosporin hydroxylase
MMSEGDAEEFAAQRRDCIERMSQDQDLQRAGLDLVTRASEYRYSYNFDWLGVPIIQHPQDMVAVQELVWRVKPDLIVETGVARGGSVIFAASLLELLGSGRVVGVDIDIRAPNRRAIEAHRFGHRVTLIEGSSTDREVVDQVASIVSSAERVMVFLDSNHTHSHVLAELAAYSPFVTVGSYLVVFDTVIEDLPPRVLADRPWGPGNSPRSAVREFLAGSEDFAHEAGIDGKLLMTVAPGGFLRRGK